MQYVKASCESDTIPWRQWQKEINKDTNTQRLWTKCSTISRSTLQNCNPLGHHTLMQMRSWGIATAAKIDMTSKSAIGDISVCKPLIRTDTTLVIIALKGMRRRVTAKRLRGLAWLLNESPFVVSDECAKNDQNMYCKKWFSKNNIKPLLWTTLINNGIFTISTGAGFLPSTVVTFKWGQNWKTELPWCSFCGVRRPTRLWWLRLSKIWGSRRGS